MRVHFDSRDEYYKSPFGAVKVGTTVRFRLKVWEPIKALRCFISVWQDAQKLDDIEMKKISQTDENEITYEGSMKVPNDPSILWYHFRLENFSEKYYYSNNDCQYGGIGKLVEDSPISYQETVYAADKTPSWFKSGIVYQIFPDRFYRGSDYEERKIATIKKIEGKNHGKTFVDDWYQMPRYERDQNGGVTKFDFFGGTLKGIEEKIDYLKELGVTLIYLNPIFEARSNHRYDTGDYKKIDLLLGDDDSFDSLIKSCKKAGIKVILDGVFSHQGADSIYFNKYKNYDSVGAYNSKDSKYYEWYNFIDFPDNYEAWWGVKELPNTKELTKSYVDYICKNADSVLKYWMKKGIAGFRLDVADELPDEFIKEIRDAIDSVKKDNILVGEVWEDATNKVSYSVKRKYFVNASLKSVTNYTFMNTVIDFMKGAKSPKDVYEFFYHQMENYPSEYFYSNFNLLDSHDRVRVITRLSDAPEANALSDDEKYNYKVNRDKYLLAISRLKALTVLQYTVPGTPVIYYGDEAGVCGYDDPYNRSTYPWGREDKSIIEHYKMLAKLRNSTDAIILGDFRPLLYTNHTFGYERNYKGDRVIVLINRGIFSNEGDHIEIDVEKGCKEAVDLIENKKIKITDDKLKVDILPLGYKVIKV